MRDIASISDQLAEQAFLSEFAKLVSHLTERLNNSPDGQHKVFRDSAVENLTGSGGYHWLAGNFLKYGAAEAAFGNKNAVEIWTIPDGKKIREIAQNIEAQIIRVPTGCQDYYPAMYGGVSAIETGPVGIVRKPIQVDLEDFNERIVLAYTGEPRNSGINNWEVTKAHIDGDKIVFRNFERIAAIANAMRAALEKADWDETARLIREEWANRKKNAPGITTPLIDRLVEATRKAGARGAKVCGAGGGGCVFFLVERGAKKRVQSIVAGEGAAVLDVAVAPHGSKVKVVKE